MKKTVTTFLFLLLGIFSVKSQAGFTIVGSFTQKDRTIEVIQTPEGRLMKRFADHKRLADRKLIKRGLKSSSASLRNDEITSSLFESFEDWDKTQVWLPQNWTWESKTGISRENPDFITWFSAASSMGINPTDGKYYEWINFGIEQSQDEWLISPSLTLQPNDALFFDANFTPFWMFYNLETDLIDYENPVSFLQALISTDNGVNWVPLWKATDDYLQYTPKELQDFFSEPEWHEIKIALNDYVGKTVKIALRYKGFFGDSNGLDRISVSAERPFTPKEPAASYAIPPGFFLAGLNPEGTGLSGVMFAPAYLPVTWYNTSFDANSYHWEMPNIYDSEKYVTTEENPSARYIQDGYYFPVLTVNWGDKTSEPYSWERETSGLFYGNAVFFAGGKITEHIGIEGLGVGNFNLINNIAVYSFDEDNHVFGTNRNDSIDGVANFFEEPSQPYVLHGVNIATSDFSAPAGTQLDLIIHRVTDGSLADTIVTATWVAGENINVQDFYNLSFKLDDPLIGDATLIELTGFYEKQNVTLACFSETFHFNKDENKAYLFAFVKGKRTLLEPNEILPEEGYTSLCFSLDMTYSFVAPRNLDYSFITGPGGGRKVFDMTTYYPSDNWSVISKVPEWLTLEFTPSSGEDGIPQVGFTVDELPEGFERRYVDVVISDNRGGQCTFEVVQDLFTGINSFSVNSPVKAINKGDFFELIYPSGWFDTANIYSISGRKIVSYLLPFNGRFDLPVSTIAQGVYILKFEGKMTKTIKIVR
ncbi:MAG: T9SS type A sorting domain-containing protein [Dysgonamonadaceae bacterium]|jgi:hypothetical protein|nr:T9SS type A sorting domain-containing protein [Dysgonamonadaceae bacterium]